MESIILPEVLPCPTCGRDMPLLQEYDTVFEEAIKQGFDYRCSSCNIFLNFLTKEMRRFGNLFLLTQGQILCYNWNRIVYLQSKVQKSELDKDEISMRIHLQNALDTENIRCTLTSEVRDSVDKIMAEVNNSAFKRNIEPPEIKPEVVFVEVLQDIPGYDKGTFIKLYRHQIPSYLGLTDIKYVTWDIWHNANPFYKHNCVDNEDEESDDVKAMMLKPLDADGARDAYETIFKKLNDFRDIDFLDMPPCEWQYAKRAIKNRYLKIIEDEIMKKHKDDFSSLDLKFIMPRQDKIICKLQQIFPTKKNLPIITIGKITKTVRTHLETTYQVIFIDETFDKRFHGEQMKNLLIELYLYKGIYNSKEYTILSKNKINSELNNITGYVIPITETSEITKSLKMKTSGNLFFVDSVESSVKTLDKESLIGFIKQNRITKEDFKQMLFSHPGGVNHELDEDYCNIIMASLLSSNEGVDGWPLHLGIIGPPGFCKTSFLECLEPKFDEPICEAGSGTLKALIPSWTTVPASPGFVLNCNRVALIDELLKMVQGEQLRSSSILPLNQDYFGKLNPILEHKKRIAGSGNNNFFNMNPTSKVIASMNSVSNKNFIWDLLGYIDPTTMTRILWLPIDEELQKFITFRKSEPILVHNLNFSPYYPIGRSDIYININKQRSLGEMVVNHVGGEVKVVNHFLSIYDSCQPILSSFDIKDIKDSLKKYKVFLPTEVLPIWEPREMHHTKLLLDGIVKLRCLFDDYDPTFTAAQCDYDTLGRFLTRIFKSYNCHLKNQIGWNAQQVDDWYQSKYGPAQTKLIPNKE